MQLTFNFAAITFIVGFTLQLYCMYRMLTEEHMNYWQLTATRATTGSEIKTLIAVPSKLGKIEGLATAIRDFQQTLGDGWDVQPRELSEKCFKERKRYGIPPASSARVSVLEWNNE